MVKGSPDAAGSSQTALNCINRARSNTWSMGCQPLPADFGPAVDEDRDAVVLTNLNLSSSVEADSSGGGGGTAPGGAGTGGVAGGQQRTKDSPTNFRKNWTRRNAWGNLSYAELITKAIESSPERRLTLSQIYDWIVHNVEYFANKGDNSSSAGWKNSIRHNLSLHSRFVRLVNDGAGKSSWWSINPEAQPLKPARRRAATLDSKAMHRKRADGAPGNRKLDLRGIEEVADSTTSGPLYASSMLGIGGVCPEEMIGVDGRLRVSPLRYHEEPGRRMPRMPPRPEDLSRHSTNGSGSPTIYGLGGYSGNLGDIYGGKGLPDLDIGCFPVNLSSTGSGKGMDHPSEGSRLLGKRRYSPEDRAVNPGFLSTGSGGYFSSGFDQQPSAHSNYFPLDPKRYGDESGCYGYSGRHDNAYFSRCVQNDMYGYYGNGAPYDSRAYPSNGCHDDQERKAKELRTEMLGSGGAAGGVYPENVDLSRLGSRSKGVATVGDEPRDLVGESSFQNSRFCTYDYDERNKVGGGGGYFSSGFDDTQQPGGTSYHRGGSPDCTSAIHAIDDPATRYPVTSKYQAEVKSEAPSSAIGTLNFFTALTTASNCGLDYPSNPGDLRSISPGLGGLDDRCFRPDDSKFPFSQDLSMKSFSQLLANRANYPTCRNGSSNEELFIPTPF